MLKSNDAKLKQYSSKQASPPRPDEGAPPAAAMLQAFLRDLQQQRRPNTQHYRRGRRKHGYSPRRKETVLLYTRVASKPCEPARGDGVDANLGATSSFTGDNLCPESQVRRNQATETRGDVPGPRLAALLRGTSGAGGDRGKIVPPVGTTMIKPQVPPKAPTEGPDTSSVDTGSSPRPIAATRSPLLLPQGSRGRRRIREPSERLLTLAQPRRPVEPPGPIRTQLSQAEDKQVVALERIRQRQSLAEAAHYQRSGSDTSSAAPTPRPALTQARLSQVSSPFGAKPSSRMPTSISWVDRDRRSGVGSVKGTEASHGGSAMWSPRVALKPRRTATGPTWLPYSKRKLREPSQRILALAQPRKTPQPPEETADTKKKKKSESGSEVASVLADKTATPEERVRVRQSKAEAAHFGRATERAKLASRWRHAKEEKAAREAAAKARAKGYLGRASSFAAARQAAQKALSTAGSDRR